MRAVVVGGFASPPALLRPLTRDLRSRGIDVSVAPLGLNVDCGEDAVGKLVRHIAEIDGPVSVVGHSRGGQLALVVAHRAAVRVERLVTIGTPWSIGPPDRPGVAVIASAIRAARRRGWSGFASIDCASGSCCEDYRSLLREKPPVPWTALWSSIDRVAGRDSLPPAAADVTVDTQLSHVGMVTSERGRALVAAALHDNAVDGPSTTD